MICRNPGGLPDWLGNVIVAVAIAVLVCFMFVYLLSYVHISGKQCYASYFFPVKVISIFILAFLCIFRFLTFLSHINERDAVYLLILYSATFQFGTLVSLYEHLRHQ